MNKKISMLLVAVVAGGVLTACNTPATESNITPSPVPAVDTSGEDEKMMKEDDKMMKKDGEAMEGEDVMMEKDGDAMEKTDGETSDAMTKGSYVTYDPSATLPEGNNVLFFAASWCPSCQGLDKDITANLGEIPEGVTIHKADYDTETELKKKFGVTYQHTMVQIDQNGELVKKWSGSNSLASLVAQVQ